MAPLKTPSRDYDSIITFQKYFWCCFWWEERIMFTNAGRVYKFNSEFEFFYDYYGNLVKSELHEKNLLTIKDKYVSWLLEKELGIV